MSLRHGIIHHDGIHQKQKHCPTEWLPDVLMIEFANAEDGTLYTFGLNSHGQLGHSQEEHFCDVRPTTAAPPRPCLLLRGPVSAYLHVFPPNVDHVGC